MSKICAFVDYEFFPFAITSIHERGLTIGLAVPEIQLFPLPDLLERDMVLEKALVGTSVAILHKDYGSRRPESKSDQNYLQRLFIKKLDCPGIISKIHEISPNTRTVVLSGEYPHGIKSCLGMKADAYYTSNVINPFELSEFDHFLNTLTRGYLTPQEKANRGRDLTMVQEDRERYANHFEGYVPPFLPRS